MNTSNLLLGLSIEASDSPHSPPGFYQLLDRSEIATEAHGRPIVLGEGTLPWCERRRLVYLIKRYGEGPPNLSMPTLGGKQIWADVFGHCRWRIQENVSNGRCRLLDPSNTRRAWGSYEACRIAFEVQRLQQKLKPTSEHAVILLHGLIRARDSMGALAKAFDTAGYEVINLNYPSTRKNIETHAYQLNQVLNRVVGIKTISFVTHSMGGMVTRTMLAMDPKRQPWRERLQVSRLLMIFPPSQGARKADKWHTSSLARVVMGPPLTELTRHEAPSIPVPDCSFAIIAGSRDKTVKVNEAALPGADYIRVMDVEHTFGMQDESVINAALHYIHGGSLLDG